MIRTLTLEAQTLPMMQETMLRPQTTMDVEPFAVEVGSEAFWRVMEGGEESAELAAPGELSDTEVATEFDGIVERLKNTTELEPTANRTKGGATGEVTTSRAKLSS